MSAEGAPPRRPAEAAPPRRPARGASPRCQPGRAGYVLVGGRSSRMGRDKALLPFHGSTLVRHVAEAVASAAGKVVLVGDPERYCPLGYSVLADRYPGEGPLGGVLTALAHTKEDWNLVLACDMPAVSADFLTCLLNVAEEADVDVLTPAGASGRPEPLCAVYHRRALTRLEHVFARGERKMSIALAAVHTTVWPVEGIDPFQNVNTPEDWAAYARD